MTTKEVQAIGQVALVGGRLVRCSGARGRGRLVVIRRPEGSRQWGGTGSGKGQ